MQKELEKITMGKRDYCPVRDVLDRVGDKWSILVLLYLGRDGKLRFNQLRKIIGDISQRMLTVTLKSLETDGYVKRTLYAEVPPRVEYELTILGNSLAAQVLALHNWASLHLDEIISARIISARANAPSELSEVR